MLEHESKKIVVSSAQEMEQLGHALAKTLITKDVVYLRGELGAGKTTLVRGILKALGYQSPVKSPTYSLIEPYELDKLSIYHIDLYRLESPIAIYNLGLDDCLHAQAVLLIEWPEKAETLFPAPT